MPAVSLTLALIRDVFVTDDAGARLARRLAEASSEGCELAVLPELPLNPWSAISRTSRDEDAEPPPPDGPRFRRLADAAREAGIAVLGGAIVRDPQTGRRLNTALLIDARGKLVHAYAKVHLPEEPGFWETSHYEAGAVPPVPVQLPGPGRGAGAGAGIALGIQICSDIHRCGAQLLAARGAEAIIVPRATEPRSFPRWRLVFQSVAQTNAAWVISVNRPDDPSVPIGGPTIVVDPSGTIVLETVQPCAVTTIDRDAVARARSSYPGYLSARADVYADGWAAAAMADAPTARSGAIKHPSAALCGEKNPFPESPT